jgi:hypothetical protein
MLIADNVSKLLLSKTSQPQQLVGEPAAIILSNTTDPTIAQALDSQGLVDLQVAIF